MSVSCKPFVLTDVDDRFSFGPSNIINCKKFSFKTIKTILIPTVIYHDIDCNQISKYLGSPFTVEYVK